MNIVKDVSAFLNSILEKKYLIFQLTRREIKALYSGSVLGTAWIILEPLAFMLILWFFFGVGLRSGDVDGAPFIVYLAAGLISWSFFAETPAASAELIRKYSFLVKKVDFRLSILPIVNIFSSSLSHLILLAVVVVIAFLNGLKPSLFFLQTGYYFFAMCVLLLGLGWLVSSVNVFFSDISKIVGIFLKFGFWITPIFWRLDIVPDKYRVLIKMNPMYYIIQGYRDSLIYNIPFWEQPYLTAYYWLVTLLNLLIGALAFRALRSHFAHVI
ncbi:MAG TPA: ABC transporter permease [Thermodesulfobacteriaceae bacterium]|nr:ABC transporter permease [Thermodesulfobacteriaceae bacterium]